jgi:hypothetical protein
MVWQSSLQCTELVPPMDDFSNSLSISPALSNSDSIVPKTVRVLRVWSVGGMIRLSLTRCTCGALECQEFLLILLTSWRTFLLMLVAHRLLRHRIVPELQHAH